MKSESGVAMSSVAVAMAQGILEPLFAKNGKFKKIHQGDNAISFEVQSLPKDFEPKGVTILNRVKVSKNDNSEFFVLRVKGKLVRLLVSYHETCPPSADGAIYTGTDEDSALSLAMKTANRMRV